MSRIKMRSLLLVGLLLLAACVVLAPHFLRPTPWTVRRYGHFDTLSVVGVAFPDDDPSGQWEVMLRTSHNGEVESETPVYLLPKGERGVMIAIEGQDSDSLQGLPHDYLTDRSACILLFKIAIGRWEPDGTFSSRGIIGTFGLRVPGYAFRSWGAPPEEGSENLATTVLTNASTAGKAGKTGKAIDAPRWSHQVYLRRVAD